MKKILLILCTCLLLLASCSSGRSGSTSNMTSVAMDNAQVQDNAAAGFGSKNDNANAGGVVSESPAQSSVTANSAITNDSFLKIIKNGTLNIETKDINNAQSIVISKVSELNGYVQSLNSDNKTISLVIRIPYDKFDGFMNESSQFGNVVSKSISTEDVSATYFDTQAHINTLKVQEQRLLDILSKGEDLKSMLEVENELARVRGEIESLEGQIRLYDNKISYSTIQINIYETSDFTVVQDTPKSFGAKIAQAFLDGIGIVKTFLENVLLILLYLLPICILLGGIAFVIIKLVKIIRKKYVKKVDKK
ncbi:MAG: DUF4349 domain-containing protein [Oscillospiraceae bacterium]|nr:DUF4349 domain-containing protein [Oscillospiraceae bacterium]